MCEDERHARHQAMVEDTSALLKGPRIRRIRLRTTLWPYWTLHTSPLLIGIGVEAVVTGVGVELWL